MGRIDHVRELRKREALMEDEELARLLSGRNRPSVLEKERRAGLLMEALRRQRMGRRQRIVGAILAAAAAVLLVVLRPPPSEPHANSALTPRGRTQPSFVARCGSRIGHCEPGDTLSFEIVARADHTHFAAFARRNDGTLVWYLPAAEGGSTPIAGDGVVLNVGVKLGPEHPAGEYVIYGVFSDTSLSRAVLRERLGPELRGREGIFVIERSLQVGEAP